MNIKRFNLVISTILLIPYAVNADGELKTVDASGTKCTTKLSLCELDPSKFTSLGLKGDKGDKGDTGPKGDTGSCVCGPPIGPPFEPPFEPPVGPPDGTDRDTLKGEFDYLDTVREWGTIINPGKTTCKDAPIDKSGTHYIFDSLEVVCDAKRKTTCVVMKTKLWQVSFSDLKPSWLSSAGIEFSDIYNLSYSQLKWLKERSETASIRIRYDCFNTNPTRKGGEVLLLSWNDLVIGSKPNASTPVHYKVENDRCSTAAKDSWASTDIVIKNTSVHRLPIIDFYIQDNEKSEQQHKITVTELCFY